MASLFVGAEPVSGYRLVAFLGRGGFGEVWRALAPGGVEVALKFVRTESGLSDAELRALSVIKNIRHPHLLDVQFFVQIEDWLVIAMPLCELTLMGRLGQCRDQGLPGIPKDELVEYMAECAKALDFLNEPRHLSDTGQHIGIQHRDVKPQNIFLVGGSVRVADFGLAKFVEGREDYHTGAMTIEYAAPEMLQNKVSDRTDQYCLAVTYHQLRVGVLPFAGTRTEVMYAHAHREPDLSDLPEGEGSAVRRAMAKDPRARWPNCASFVQALRAANELVDDKESNDDFHTGGVEHLDARHSRGNGFKDTNENGDESTPPRKKWWLGVGAAAALLGVLVILNLAEFGSDPVIPRPVPIVSVSPSHVEKPKETELSSVLPDAHRRWEDEIPVYIAEEPSDAEVPPADPELAVEQGEAATLVAETIPEVPAPKAPVIVPRQRIDTLYTLSAVQRDLRSLDPARRAHQRYLSLAALHNRDQSVTDDELRATADALARMIQRLTGKTGGKCLRPVDEFRTVFALDVGELGWSAETIDEIVCAYPYGLRLDQVRDESLAAAAREVMSLTGSELPIWRADWLIDAASQSPLSSILASGNPARSDSSPATEGDLVAAARERYGRDLNLADVAAELGIDADELSRRIQDNAELRELGLDRLLSSGTLSRAEWSSTESFVSLYQQTASALDLGSPHREVASRHDEHQP